jgi:glycosyltransferase involved in cell wall biosynthesis
MPADIPNGGWVTVVIPCYNSGATICQTIASVQCQTWPQIEIVVVDDGSTDLQTVTVLDAIKGVRLVRQQNAGLPAARNAGFAAATGDYFLPLDSDDWLEPDAIENLLLALKEDPSASFAYSHLQLEGEACGVLAKSYNFFEQLFLNQMPYSLLLPRSVLDSVGGYDESMIKGYEDWEFNIRLGARGFFGHVVPRPLLHYRVNSTSMLIAKSNPLHGELWGRIQQKHSSLYRMPRLICLWREWRTRPSTYPLSLYFGWITIYRLLPITWFAALFRWLRKRSHSNRVTSYNVRG